MFQRNFRRSAGRTGPAKFYKDRIPVNINKLYVPPVLFERGFDLPFKGFFDELDLLNICQAGAFCRRQVRFAASFDRLRPALDMSVQRFGRPSSVEACRKARMISWLVYG